MSATPSESRPSGAALATLFVSSGGLLGLAIYQWLELIHVRTGGTAACSVNETVNCATVWDSPFSHMVQEWLGIPVAGLGVLWGAVALLLAFLTLQRPATFRSAVKAWALVGLLSCVTFISASFQARAVCLTCLGTYALTAVYAFGAMKLLGGGAVPPARELIGGLGWGLVLTVPLFFGLLYPGSKTPLEAASVPKLDKHNPDDFDAVMATLSQREKLTAAWARNEWKNAPAHDTSMFPVHAHKGKADAPVRIVEFTDILCGHCAQFEEMLREIEGMSPEGGLSIEPRYYPLDEECNPDIKGTAGDGVRCYGAKLQICAELHPKFFLMRREFFQNQRQLDQGMMLAIAKRHGVDTDALAECIKSPATASRLGEDIAYARKFNIQGTPLVLLNGKATPPSPVFLLGMVLSGGNVDAPYFQRLPPPPPPNAPQ